MVEGSRRLRSLDLSLLAALRSVRLADCPIMEELDISSERRQAGEPPSISVEGLAAGFRVVDHAEELASGNDPAATGLGTGQDVVYEPPPPPPSSNEDMGAGAGGGGGRGVQSLR